MNGENIVSESTNTLNEQPSGNVIQAPNPASVTNETPKNNIAKDDISNVKIRSILKQRFKKWRPGLRKAIPLILVGIICFAAGIGADRVLIRHRAGKVLNNRPGINQTVPNSKFNNKQFKNRANNSPNGSYQPN